MKEITIFQPFFLGGGEGEVQSAGARVLSGFFFLPFVLTSALSLSQGFFPPVSPAHPAFLLGMFVKQEFNAVKVGPEILYCSCAIQIGECKRSEPDLIKAAQSTW